LLYPDVAWPVSSTAGEILKRAGLVGPHLVRSSGEIKWRGGMNWLRSKSISDGSWLDRHKGRKPRMLVAVALANKMARMIWAIASRKEVYRNPEQSMTAC